MAYWKETHYKSEYAARLIEHMKKGLSFNSFGSEIITPHSTIEKWLTTQPEFKAAYAIAKSARICTFEKLMITGAMGGKVKGIKGNVNARLVEVGLKASDRKQYGDKIEHDVASDTEIKIEYRKAN